MKKSFFISLCFAAVLGLTACVEQQNVSPGFVPADNSINTQFYFNISAMAGQSYPDTKQADTNVQAKANFRGIDNATIFALANNTVTKDTPPAGRKMVEPTTADAMRDLSAILAQSAIREEAGGTRIVEINLPVGTNQLVFYAKAARKEIPGLDSKELYGSLQYTTAKENYMNLKDEIGSFAERRLSSRDSMAFAVTEEILIKVLNGIFFTEVIGINAPTSPQWYQQSLTEAQRTVEFAGQTYTIDTLRWADYGCAGVDDNPVSPYFKNPGGYPEAASELEKIIGKAYQAMTNAPTEVRAGSGSSTARVLSDLYNIVSAVAEATPVTLSEKVAMVLAAKMVSNIELFTEPLPGSLTGERIWKNTMTVRTNLNNVLSPAADNYRLDDFPVNMHLPLGAVTIGPDSVKLIPRTNMSPIVLVQLKYTSSLDTLMNGPISETNLYTYPPELCYYGNSSIRTNNSNTLNNGSYPQDYRDWNSETAWSGKNWESDGTAISNSTRGIAMTNTIQYGVSLLESKLLMSEKTGLTDNGTLSGQTKTFSIDESHYIEWTGILIGGQPEQVGWDYLLRKTGDTKAGMNAIVYDRVNYRLSEKGTGRDTSGMAIKDAGYAGGADWANYTLVYDNVDPYVTSDDPQGDVYVALEFKNRLGQDFWGEQGLIRDGASFYLFAKLTPTPNATGIEQFWTNVFKEDDGYNNHYLLPPYYTSGGNYGASRPIRRVFVQDIMTRVVFQFRQDALSHAYISVPDLRSAKISLGLAVDLNWESGITYIVPLGQR